MIDNNMHGLDLGQSHEFFFVAITMLYQQQKTTMLPELMQVLTPNQIIALAQIYDGKPIVMPTPDELSVTLKAAVFLYKRDFLHQPEAEVILDLELEGAALHRVRTTAARWYSQTKDTLGHDYFKTVARQRAAA
jgi:hypothetical protein